MLLMLRCSVLARADAARGVTAEMRDPMLVATWFVGVVSALGMIVIPFIIVPAKNKIVAVFDNIHERIDRLEKKMESGFGDVKEHLSRQDGHMSAQDAHVETLKSVTDKASGAVEHLETALRDHAHDDEERFRRLENIIAEQKRAGSHARGTT